VGVARGVGAAVGVAKDSGFGSSRGGQRKLGFSNMMTMPQMNPRMNFGMELQQIRFGSRVAIGWQIVDSAVAIIVGT